jgi:hypothetical protein
MANMALELMALALSVGAAGAIVLLLVGTQLLNWYWPILLALCGLGLGLLRARGKVLPSYRLAQIVDSRLSLQDRLSTVYYFRNLAQHQPESLDTIEAQAESRLHEDDAVRAIPLKMPRSAYVSVALLLMCLGMVGLRYGLLHTLDLSKPLARIEFTPFNEPPNVQASTKKSIIQEKLEEQLKQLGLSVDDLNQQDGDAMQPQQENIAAVPSQEGEPGPGEEGQSTGEKGPASEGENGEPGDNGDPAEGKPEGQEGSDSTPGAQSKPQTPPATPKNPGKSGEQNSGLMDKMKDAMANLMNKLKSPPKDQGQQTASNQNMQQQGSQQTPGQKGMQSQNRSQGEGQPNPDQKGEQEGDGEKTPGDQSRAGDKNADRAGSQDPKTGMGKQDGSKEIQDAEQLAAMGKISEIFGKRAQQITGEMSIEVPSGKQQLKTAYTDRQAAHSGTGGEVNRDEIPLAYQPYIQRYFEEVRKLPSKAKIAPPPAAATPQPPATLAR